MKKILWYLLTIFIIMSISSTGYAQKVEEYKDNDLLMPEDNTVTSEDTILLSGKAEYASNVDIYVYNYDSIDNINKIVNEPTFKTNIKTGELERFNAQLKLPSGNNQIIVKINKDGKNHIFSRIVSVTDKALAEEYIRNIHVINDYKEKQILKMFMEKK